MGDVLDLTTYKESIASPHSNFWIDAMKDEMTSISQNKVWSSKWLQTHWMEMGVHDQAQCQGTGRDI